MRDSFVFYRSFFESIKELEDTDQLSLFKAIIKYALDGEEPQLVGVQKAIFILMRPNLDANTKRWENGKKGAEYGKKGGRPKKGTPYEPQENPTETPNKDKDVDKDMDKDANKDNKLFVPPTLDEVKAYITEKDLNVNSGIFFEYYSGQEWCDRDGKQVKNWKLKAQAWSGKADAKGEYNRIELSDSSVELGIGEFTHNGKRCYGDRKNPVIIPDRMPPRPNNQCCLDRENLKWIIQ